MTGRRWILGSLAGLTAVTLAGVGFFLKTRSNAPAPASELVASPADANTPLANLAERLRVGDAKALAAVFQRSGLDPNQAASPLTQDEAEGWVAVLDGLRAGYLKFAPVGRVTAVFTTSRALNRFTTDPAPGSWVDALYPSHALLSAALADNHAEVRATALIEIGRYWNWLPGRAMTPAEEVILANWKDAFREPATRLLGDRDPKSRAAAVVCLGSSPIDAMAALAAPYIDDPDNGGVRYHTLKTLATRTAVLSDDAILRRLHDTEPGLPELAEIVLKARGLTKEQIFLGRQLYHPKPEVRVSIVPLICERTDIDPTIWLLQLTHDADETVRAKAAEALVGRTSPDVLDRLRAMVASDPSASVKAAAGKIMATFIAEASSSLPPLPGSTNLNLKAN